MKLLFANSGEPDQTPQFVAFDLVSHYLPISHNKDARLIWVKQCILGKTMSLALTTRDFKVILCHKINTQILTFVLQCTLLLHFKLVAKQQ